MANGRLATSISRTSPPRLPAGFGALRITQTDGYSRLKSMATRARWAAYAVLLAILTSCAWCQSAEFVLVRTAGMSSNEQRELELATQFYGVNLKVVTAGDSDSGSALRAVRQNTTIGVAIQADALAGVSQDELLRALRGSVPLLIFGVTPETGSTLLSTWSGGAAVDIRRLEGPLPLHYVVGRVPGITQQLTDLEIPFPGNSTFYFALA